MARKVFVTLLWFWAPFLLDVTTAYGRDQPTAKLPDLIDAVRPSIVVVGVHLVRNPETPIPEAPPEWSDCFLRTTYCIAGTGLMVNPDGDVVTALHVVDGYAGKDGKNHPGISQILESLRTTHVSAEIVIGVPMPNVDDPRIVLASGSAYYPAKLVATEPRHDLALIRTTVNPFRSSPRIFSGLNTEGLPSQTVKAVTFSNDRPRDGEDVFAGGYPFSEQGLVTTSGTIASAWKSEVLLRAEAAGFASPQEVYTVDLRINPGNSGGPVFRASDQAVVGVAVQTFGNLGVVVPAKVVTAFLTSKSVSWTVVPANVPAEARSGAKQLQGPR